MWLWVKTNGIFGGAGAPPILVGIGMFTGGTNWILTHGHIFLSSRIRSPLCCPARRSSPPASRLAQDARTKNEPATPTVERTVRQESEG